MVRSIIPLGLKQNLRKQNNFVNRIKLTIKNVKVKNRGCKEKRTWIFPSPFKFEINYFALVSQYKQR